MIQIPIVYIFIFSVMFVTHRGNNSDLEYCIYPTIKNFPGFIQLFDAKFTTIAPHSLVVFQLQYAIYVKDALSINKLTYLYNLESI
jgi:hypothetical protein